MAKSKNRNQSKKEVRPVSEQEQGKTEVKETPEVTAETSDQSQENPAPVVDDAAKGVNAPDQQDTPEATADAPAADPAAAPAPEVTDAPEAAAEETKPSEEVEEELEEETEQEEVEALTPGEKEVDDRVINIVGGLARLQDDGGKYYTGMEFMRAVDGILLSKGNEKTGALITRLVTGLKSHGITEVSIAGVLSSARFAPAQREYIKIIAMLFFNGDTKGGRDQLSKQLSVEKIMTAVGQDRAVTIKKWLGVS